MVVEKGSVGGKAIARSGGEMRESVSRTTIRQKRGSFFKASVAEEAAIKLRAVAFF